jgi:hypothetical protein
VGVGEHLHLDVAAAFDQALEHQRAVAEGAPGLAPRAGQRLRQLGEASRTSRMPRPPPPATALTSSGRPSACASATRRIVALVLAQVAGCAGHAGGEHAALGGRLVAHGTDGLRRRADEHQAGGRAGLGELGALGQEPVARVHGVCAPVHRAASTSAAMSR